MTKAAGIVNLFMLLGLCLFVFKVVWSLIFAVVHAVLKVSKSSRTVPLNLVYAVWGYFLASQTTLAVTQARQTIPEIRQEYEWIGAGLLLLFMAADRITNIWLAERKLDKELQEIIKWQHFLALALLIYGLLNIFVWPAWGHLEFTRWSVALAQRMLMFPFLGICLGVFGLIYEIRLIMRLIKFVRIGPKGLPPFPESLRK